MTFCGKDCCKDCERLSQCGGCEACKGHPFGGSCIAERNKNFKELEVQLIEEINALKIEGLVVDQLYLLSGGYVNLEYPLENGKTAKFLNDNDVYLGNQIEQKGAERCYGVISNENFILVCEYGINGSNPTLVLYKRR